MISAAVLQYLDTQGLVVHGRPGTDAFLEGMRDLPVEQVVAFVRPGAGETDGGHGYDEPGVQLLVRGATGSARDGYERAVTLRDALHGLSGVTLAPGTPDEVYVVQCVATQSVPTNLGDDPDGRPRWSIPFRFEVRNPTPLRP